MTSPLLTSLSHCVSTLTNQRPHISREALVHQLYEAAELEHNLMCTYLYAAFSLRSGTEEGLSAAEADATARWRRAILKVAVEEMGHLTAVWNITAALGGSPRFGRMNFPLDPGALPANVVVRLAPFSEAVLQHFIYLERPSCSAEPDGEGFEPDFSFTRGDARAARHADADRLRNRGRVLRDVCRRTCAPSSRAWARRKRSAATATCSSRARRSTSRVATR